MGFQQRLYEHLKSHLRERSRKVRRLQLTWVSDRDEVIAKGGGVPPFFSGSIFLEVHMSLRDVLGGRPSPDAEFASHDEAFAKRCPTLVELMTSREKMEDGKRREVCTLTVVAEDGMWKGGLRERNYQMSLWVSAKSLQDVLDTLEEVLQQRPVPWRKTADYTPRNRQKG